MSHSLSLPASKTAMDNLFSFLLVVTLPQLPSLTMMVCWFSYYITTCVFGVCIYYNFKLVASYCKKKSHS